MEIVYWIVGVVFEYFEDFFGCDYYCNCCVVRGYVFCYCYEIWFDVIVLIVKLFGVCLVYVIDYFVDM